MSTGKAEGKLDAAVAQYRQAVLLAPGFAEAHNQLGMALVRRRNLEEAVKCFRRAVELRADYVQAHNNLGAALAEQGELDEAAACWRRALEQKPDYAEAHLNLGGVLATQNKLDEAVACCRRVLELRPELPSAHFNLGAVLARQAKLREASACYKSAVQLKPDYVEARVNHSHALLALGQFAEGWPLYEWRWKQKGRQEPIFSQPRWTGAPLVGRTILLCAEQGLGDTLQFIRYVRLIEQQGMHVLVEVQPCLVPLLRQSGFRGVVAKGAPRPEVDVHAPLMSLPGILGTTLENIPDCVPYLAADAGLVEHWRGVLGAASGWRIGIAWQGSAAHQGDAVRSIPLAQFAPLASEGVELISLQKGAGSEQLADAGRAFFVRELGPCFDEEHGAFRDTAAVMKNLDLVVTCDSALAHLAGGLGVRVWVALSYAPDWRWMLERTDSPWYPTIRLFRQSTLGDWKGVFQRIKEALIDELRDRSVPKSKERAL